jgi:hypothetical protein
MTTPAHSFNMTKVRDLIAEMRHKDPSLNFTRCWNILTQQRPELFDEAPHLNPTNSSIGGSNASYNQPLGGLHPSPKD